MDAENFDGVLSDYKSTALIKVSGVWISSLEVRKFIFAKTVL